MKAQKVRKAAGLSSSALVALSMCFCSPAMSRAQQASNAAAQGTAPVQAAQQPSPATQSYSSSLASSEAPSPDGSATPSPAQDVAQAQSAPAPGTAQNQQPAQKPVGTAAAPPESAAGVTAARPAGAVIAPAKQRRVRTILIRVGLLVGAGVALGTVMALSHATPSQPQ